MKKALLWVVVLVLSISMVAAFSFAGCKAAAPAEEEAAAPAEEEAAAPAEEEEEVVKKGLAFWNMPFVTQEVSPEYVQKWEEDVKTALPNYEIDNFYGPGKYKDQRDKFLLQAESGKPDVIEGLLEDTAVYVQKGLIEPLDSYFSEWDESDQFVESTLAPLTIGGKLYGLPYNTNARAMIYRKDIFEEYGLSLPKTWDELVQTARKITELTNKETYGFFVCTEVGDPRAGQEFMSWYFQVNGRKDMFEVTDGKITFNATVDQLEKVLGLYNDLFEEVDYPACDPNVKGTGWPVEDPGYVAGQWAMAPMGPWLWGRRTESDIAKDILENKSAMTQLPYCKDGVPATYLEVKPIMMNAYGDKEGAWELIKYIVSKEKMGEWLVDSGGIPARKDTMEMDIFEKAGIQWWMQGFANELPISVAMSPINWGPVSIANLQAVNFVIYGEKTPKEAAQWLYDTINELSEKGEL